MCVLFLVAAVALHATLPSLFLHPHKPPKFHLHSFSKRCPQHSHPPGEDGFPCSRCFVLSLRCLPNNWVMEKPVPEYVLTTHSPKVRRGCLKGEKGGRKQEGRGWREGTFNLIKRFACREEEIRSRRNSACPLSLNADHHHFSISALIKSIDAPITTILWFGPPPFAQPLHPPLPPSPLPPALRRVVHAVL